MVSTRNELLYIANDATLRSRRGKDPGPVDWDALAVRWDATIGGELAGVAPAVSNARGPGAQASEHHGGRTRWTAHAGGPGAGAGQGPGPGLGQASGLDAARPAQAARPDHAGRDPADEPAGRAGTAARPFRGGRVGADRGDGVLGGPAVAAAARVAAPSAGRVQRVLPARRRRAVCHHHAAGPGRACGRARPDPRRAAAAG